jgi:hypothetical protein
LVQIFIQASSPEIWREIFLAVRTGTGVEVGWLVFGLPSLGKNLSAAAARQLLAAK